MHAANIYSTELSSLGNGHGLWEPNPGNEYPRVEIGDIGFIQAGFFHRLFNALVPADDPSQKWGVPEHYEPLRLPFPDFKFSRHPLLGQLHSTSVKVVSSNLSATGGPVVAGSAKVSFSCTKERGAALVLPEETIRQDAHFGRWFREYCLKNYRTWLVFANDTLGFDLELSDLILVTGCDLTTQWAMAAFAHSEFQAGLGLGVSVPGGALSAEFEVRSGWRADQSVQHRCGPQSSRFVEPERVGSSHSQRSDSRNQCVFIRGYRVKERRLLGPKVIRAASGPSDLGSGDRGADWESSITTPELSPETSVEVQSISGNTKDVNLLAPILDYILDESDACVAIAHDEDIWPYITGLDVLSRETAIIKVDGNHVGRILPKFRNVDSSSPRASSSFLRSVTSLEMLSERPKGLTLRPSYTSLDAPVHKRSTTTSTNKCPATAPPQTKETKPERANTPLSKLGQYFKPKSLRKTPSTPVFTKADRAFMSAEETNQPHTLNEPRKSRYWRRIGWKSSQEQRGRTKLDLDHEELLRREGRSGRLRLLSTVRDDPQEEERDPWALPVEYRLDLPPPYALQMPAQYRLQS